MKTSESIGEISKALVKAQSEMSEAKKDAKNPFFKSNYADMASVMEACKKALHDNKIGVIQSPIDKEGSHYMETTFFHESGEYISNTMQLTLEKPTMQALGSAITYARRYMLQAMAFIPSIDDDGNEANNYPKAPSKRAHRAGPPTAKQKETYNKLLVQYYGDIPKEVIEEAKEMNSVQMGEAIGELLTEIKK